MRTCLHVTQRGLRRTVLPTSITTRDRTILALLLSPVTCGIMMLRNVPLQSRISVVGGGTGGLLEQMRVEG